MSIRRWLAAQVKITLRHTVGFWLLILAIAFGMWWIAWVCTTVADLVSHPPTLGQIGFGILAYMFSEDSWWWIGKYVVSGSLIVALAQYAISLMRNPVPGGD